MAKFLNIHAGRVNVHEEAVQSYIRAGGAVHDLLNAVAQDTSIYGKAYVANGHVRSGRLLRGIGWNRAKLDGPLSGVARTYSSAKHTQYFHEGTGTIFHPWMIVPNNRHAAHTSLAFSGAGAEQLALWKARTPAQQKRGRGFKLRRTVRGQRAKPFLREGLASSLAKHGLK